MVWLRSTNTYILYWSAWYVRIYDGDVWRTLYLEFACCVCSATMYWTKAIVFAVQYVVNIAWCTCAMRVYLHVHICNSCIAVLYECVVLSIYICMQLIEYMYKIYMISSVVPTLLCSNMYCICFYKHDFASDGVLY